MADQVHYDTEAGPTVEYNQPTSALVPKIMAVAKANAISTAIPAVIALLAAFGVIVPDGTDKTLIALVPALITLYSLGQSIFTTASGYFKRDAKPAAAVNVIQLTHDNLKG